MIEHGGARGRCPDSPEEGRDMTKTNKNSSSDGAASADGRSRASAPARGSRTAEVAGAESHGRHQPKAGRRRPAVGRPGRAITALLAATAVMTGTAVGAATAATTAQEPAQGTAVASPVAAGALQGGGGAPIEYASARGAQWNGRWTGGGNYPWMYNPGPGESLPRGWMLYKGDWYYLGFGGIAFMGWSKIGGNWYYFDMDSSKMVTGWLKWDGNWYYLYPNGVMAVGWHWIDGQWYWFNASGAWS